ncbi:hypothetical protein LINGRAHAP2_LOCUS10288 [Linum grandiflorum]
MNRSGPIRGRQQLEESSLKIRVPLLNLLQ